MSSLRSLACFAFLLLLPLGALAQQGTVTASGGTVASGATFAIPITLSLNSGVTIDSLSFGISVAANGGAPVPTTALTFTPNSAKSIPTPGFHPTGSTSTSVTLALSWLQQFSPPLSGTVTLGTVNVVIPSSASNSQTYTITIASTPDGSLGNSTEVPLAAGPPATLTVAAAATPVIALTTSSLTFSAAPGGANPASQTVGIANGGGGTLSWTASASTTSGGNWLSVTPTSGTNSGSITVSVNTAGLAAGSYSGRIQIAATGASNTPQTINVTLGLGDFTLAMTPATQTVAPGASAAYTVAVNISGGFTSAVTLSCSGLPAGAACTFTPNPANAGGSSALSVTTSSSTPVASTAFTVTGTSGSLTHSATATVVVSTPAIALSTISLSFSAVAGGASPASQTVNVLNSGGGTLSWTAAATTSSGGNWLSITPNSGANAGTITVLVNTAGLAAGSYSGTIQVSASGASNSPKSIAVTLNLAAANDFSIAVSPGTQTVNPAASAAYTVSISAGTGFSSSVTLSCSGLPANAACAFSPNPAPPGNVALLVSTLGTTPVGSTTFTVTATSGSLSHSGTATLIVQLATPLFTSAGITNGASFASGVTVGSIVTIFGSGITTGLTPDQIVLSDGPPLRTILMGTSVTASGATTSGGILAPLFAIANTHASGEQINLQVPYELTGQSSLTFVVNNNGGQSAPVQVSALNAQPGIFADAATSAGAILHNADFQLVTAANPATAGEYVAIYATGLGPVSPAPATGAAASNSPLSNTQATPVVTIGGVNATVAFSGLAPGFVGLYQVTVQVPSGISSSPADVVIQMSNQSSKAVKLAMQ